MKLLQQPGTSRTCGHHCLAMILDVPVQTIIEHIGHEKGTWAKDLIKVLHDYGYNAHYSAFRNEKYLTNICILGIKWKKGGHWHVYNNGIIYDPGYFTTFRFEDRFHREVGGHYNQVINLWNNIK